MVRNNRDVCHLEFNGPMEDGNFDIEHEQNIASDYADANEIIFLI